MAGRKKQETSEKKTEWAFPTKSACPRCKATDTLATHTDTENGIQYRRCQRAVCRHSYKVPGSKI
jgi:Zn ribbon nucleic-acid-binding protein